MGLATFKGGVHPYEGKELSEHKPVQILMPKGDLVYPMSQHIGAPAIPLVKKGDKVLAGQKIGEASGFISANVICSVSGTVKAVEPRRVANGAMVNSIVVENDGEYTAVEGLGADRDPAKLSKQEIRDIVMANKAVCGIHDLVVHDYGPGRVMISLHAEVPAHGDILTLHDEIDNVEKQLHDKLGCEAVIHMDPIVTNDEAVNVTHQRIAALVRGIDENISIHDFRMVTGPTHTNVIFDAVVPYGCKMSDREAEEKIKKAVHELDPSYFAVVQIDKSYVR